MWRRRRAVRTGTARARLPRKQSCPLPLWLTCCDDHAAVGTALNGPGPGSLLALRLESAPASALTASLVAGRGARGDPTRHALASIRRTPDLIPATAPFVPEPRREACARAPLPVLSGRGFHEGSLPSPAGSCSPPCSRAVSARGSTPASDRSRTGSRRRRRVASLEPGDDLFRGHASLERAALDPRGAAPQPRPRGGAQRLARRARAPSAGDRARGPDARHPIGPNSLRVRRWSIPVFAWGSPRRCPSRASAGCAARWRSPRRRRARRSSRKRA